LFPLSFALFFDFPESLDKFLTSLEFSFLTYLMDKPYSLASAATFLFGGADYCLDLVSFLSFTTLSAVVALVFLC
jgi:hypothetical protein